MKHLDAFIKNILDTCVVNYLVKIAYRRYSDRQTQKTSDYFTSTSSIKNNGRNHARNPGAQRQQCSDYDGATSAIKDGKRRK